MARRPLIISDEATLRLVVTALDKRAGLADAAQAPAQLAASRDGVLERGGVRHVIFRAETVRVLLSLACEHQHYYDSCRRIGQTAANDLWHCFKHGWRDRVVIPESVTWLMRVWCEWDTSGGWGICSFSTFNAPNGVGPQDWVLRVDKNFLRHRSDADTLIKIDDIHDFWSGYIHGFLGDAAMHAFEPLYETYEPDHAKTILSSYPTVVNVLSDDEDDVVDGVDRFRVRLDEDSLLPLWDHLGRAHSALSAGRIAEGAFECQQACLWARTNPRTREVFGEAMCPDDDPLGLLKDQAEVIDRLLGGRGTTEDRFVRGAYEACKSLGIILHRRAKEIDRD